MALRRGLLSLFALVIGTSGCSLLSSQSDTARGDTSYRIVKGDTLHEISERYGITSADLQRYNEIADPRNLQIGQVIKIPGIGPTERAGFKRVTAGDIAVVKPDTPLQMISITRVKGYVGALETPIETARLTSHFGWRWKRFHEGSDLAARKGTPIRAAHDGKVVLVSEDWGRYGKVVVIQGDGLMTLYGHNNRNHVDLGDLVSQGDHIADVGSTGDATGPHLHFETRVQNENGHWAAINPLVFYPDNQ